MSIAGKLRSIQTNVEKAFDDYCSDLEDKERSEVHEWVGAERKSIDTRSQGRMKAKVGINEGKLLANQYNSRKVNYANYDIGGHDEAIVSFTRRVPNSTESGGLWWHYFPAVGGYSPITDALRSMSKFKSYYKKI